MATNQGRVGRTAALVPLPRPPAARPLALDLVRGTFACLLARRGLAVAAVDPAGASLEVARSRPGAERVRWLRGYATDLPGLRVDLVTMTANVAQVFVADEEWAATCAAGRAAHQSGVP
jgi:hypothetical protein